ncbi:hypothetical protein KCU99_g9781, partial [Aureobasidium melanogenum]
MQLRSIDVTDIRSANGTATGLPLAEEVLESLRPNIETQLVSEEGYATVQWNKKIPTSILYEGRGIDLYERITQDPAYYLYNDELSIFKKYASEMATLLLQFSTSDRPQRPKQTRPVHLTLIDLGAGRLDKSQCLLDAMSDNTKLGQSLDNVGPSVAYYAVDMQHEQLRQRISRLVEQRPHFAKDHPRDVQHCKVTVHGICGSYHDTIDYMRAGKLDQEDVRRPRTVQAQAAKFLRQFSRDGIMQAEDFMLVGIDRCRDSMKVKAAYNERSKCWQDYVLNGVSTAADLTDLPELYSSRDDWEYVARWDADQGRHVRFARSSRHRSLSADIEIQEGEHVFLAQSYKYTTEDAECVFRAAGLQTVYNWVNDSDDCSIFLLRKPHPTVLQQSAHDMRV